MIEYRKLPKNTYMVETEKGIIFVNATSYAEADKKAEDLGYKQTCSYETVEVHL